MYYCLSATVRTLHTAAPAHDIIRMHRCFRLLLLPAYTLLFCCRLRYDTAVKEFLKFVKLSDEKVEEAKSMEVDVTYKDDASKEKTESVPFATVKIDGEWYAAMPRAALI